MQPLKGMPLTYLTCDNSQVADLSPLSGMPLTSLVCHVTKVADLSPLKGMPLEELYCDRTLITDLSPLAGMKLKKLSFHAKSRAEGTASHSTDEQPGGNWDCKRQNDFQQQILETI